MKSKKQIRRIGNKSKKFREMNCGGGRTGEKLNEACKIGASLRKIVSIWNGVNDNYREERTGYTSLMSTIQNFTMERKDDYLNVFYWLLNTAKCELHTRDRERETALNHVLYRYEFSINGVSKRRTTYDEKIIFNEMAVALINKLNYSVNLTNNDGNSPLHIACTTNNIEIVKFLLQKFGTYKYSIDSGSSNAIAINMKNKEKKTPLHIVSDKGFTDIANILLNDGNIEINVIDKRGWTPLHYAYVSNNIDLAITLLDKGAKITKAVTNNITEIDKLTDNGIVSNEKLREFLEPLKKQNDERKKERRDANSRILNSIKTREGLLAPNVLDIISEFAEKDVSRPLTPESIKRSQDGRDKRHDENFEKMEKIKVERDEKLQKEIAFKNFGGKRKTKKRKTRKN